MLEIPVFTTKWGENFKTSLENGVVFNSQNYDRYTAFYGTNTITNYQSLAGVRCGNITEFGVATPNKVILTQSTPAEGCFVFMPCYSYNYISLSNCKLLR